MMGKKRYYLPFVVLPFLLAVTLPAAAPSGLESVMAIAGLTVPAQQETIGISPPGWLGGALAVLALILPVVVWFWLRRQQD